MLKSSIDIIWKLRPEELDQILLCVGELWVDAPEEPEQQKSALNGQTFQKWIRNGLKRSMIYFEVHVYLSLKKSLSPRRVVAASITRSGSQALGVTGGTGSGLSGLTVLEPVEVGFTLLIICWGINHKLFLKYYRNIP